MSAAPGRPKGEFNDAQHGGDLMTTAGPAHALQLYDYELSGNCYKVRLLLNWLGLGYTRIPVDFHPGRAHRSAHFVDHVNPRGQLPVLQDGAFLLPDAQAILVYLASRYDPHGRWYPTDAPTRGRIGLWLATADDITRTVSAARLHLGEIGAQFLEEFVVGRHGDHGHVVVHQGKRAVLQFAGGIGLGVDVGNLFELQRTLQCHGVLRAAAEEQRMALLHEVFGYLADTLVEQQHAVDKRGQGAHGIHEGALDGLACTVALGKHGGEQHQRDKLRGECLGGGNADFRSRLGHDGEL